MLSGGNFPNNAGPDPSSDDCEASVGFIQVCRNPLRSYNRSWNLLNDGKFLKYIYESGIGFFHCNNGNTFDMVVPIRIKSDDGICYIPMLMSTKSFAESNKKSHQILENSDRKTEQDWDQQCTLFMYCIWYERPDKACC